MVKKIFSSMLALIMVFVCIPMMAQALPEGITLDQHVADGDTSDTASDYWGEGNELWADKSIFDNGDGSMNVLISLQAHQVADSPEGEPVGAVIDGDLTVNDNLGSGFSFGDSISVNMGSSYIYSVSGGWAGGEPDGVSISVNGSNLVVSISGDALLIAGGFATISYVANCSATESGTYYVSGGCTVMASGALADRSEIFSKSNDAVQDGGVACAVEISGGRQVSELGNNGLVTITKVVYYEVSYSYDGDYPSDITVTLPSDDMQYQAGASVNAIQPSVTTVRGNVNGKDGTWSFDGWDEDTKQANGDVTFVGTWTFTADPDVYHESYRYEDVTDETVLATLPDRNEDYYAGNVVIPARPSSEMVTTEDGTYVFNGWAPESVTIQDSDAEFVGTWLFQEKPEPVKVHVAYVYSGEVSADVAVTLPSDETEYDEGAEIIPIQPTSTTVPEETGMWTFDGWSRTDSEGLVTFTGTWTFTTTEVPSPEDPEPPVSAKFTVLYRYEEGIDDAVWATLPSDSNEYDTAEEILSVAPNQIQVTVDNGVWEFGGWTRSEDETVVIFTGSWTFTPSEPVVPEDPIISKYHVVYEYADVTDIVVLGTLPTDENEYDDGSLILASRPKVDSITMDDGVWTFTGWDADTKTIEGADIKFIGTWEFTPKQPDPIITGMFSVYYTYADVTDSDVLATLPTDDTSYSSGFVVSPASPRTSTVTVSNGVWTFAGWDAEEKQIIDEDITFVGTWSFTLTGSGEPDPQPPVVGGQYHVVYRYADVDNADVLATLPTDDNVYAVGEQIIPESPSSTLVILPEGMWSFRGWDETLKQFVDGDIEFVGAWEFIPNAPEYGVVYQYNNADSLPAAVLATLPVDSNTYKSGITINAATPSAVEVDVDGTLWKFNGWNSTSQTVQDGDVVFVGSWSVPATGHYVFYQYADENTLPSVVMNTLPVESGPHDSGTIIYPVNPSSMQLEVGNDLWIFDGWNVDHQTVEDKDITFVGSWVKEEQSNPDPVGPGSDTTPYGEHYMYSGSVSAEVEATLPTRFGIYANGTTVIPEMPSSTEVPVQGGKWIFVGWDAQYKVIENGDVTFYGTWTFVSDVTNYTEHYVYEGIEDADVLETLPDRQGVYINGDQVFPVTPSSEIVITDEGTWSFIGWTPTVATVVNGDVTFYGKWDFVAKEIPTYTEVYQYSDIEDADVLATLPTRKGEYHTGDSVIPAQPLATVVETEAGTYTFNGWDVASRVVNEADVVFTGSWAFEPKPVVIKYSEKYAYADVTDPMVIATLPTRADMYEVGVLVIPAQPSATSLVTDDGTWTFNGWDAAGRVIVDKDVTFVGTWTFTPKQVDPEPQTYYGEFYKYEGEDLPEEVMATLPLRTGSYVAGDVVVPAAPSAEVVTLETGIWTFLGWDAESQTIVDADITFVGTWKFEEAVVPVVHYSASYKYDKEYPVEVMQALPVDTNQYDDGDVVKALDPLVTAISSVYNDQQGTWAFGGWDAAEKTVEGANVVFVGTWSFTPAGSHQKYTEFYKYDQEYPAEVMATLPMSARMFENGTVVVPADPTASLLPGEVDGKIGIWKFNGWDEPQKIVNGAAVIFTGSWTFEEDSAYIVNITLKAVWLDDNNASNLRPDSVHVKLFGGSEKVLDVDLDSTQGYQAIFEGLPSKLDGVDIQYSVAEDVPDGYMLSLATKYVAATVDTPGSIEFILTNTLESQGIALPETGSMEAIWVTLGGMLLIGFGVFVLRPKRKHE